MILTIDKNSVVVFDLDDTLYFEIDFLKSAYRFISNQLENEIGKNIYEEMLGYYFEKKSTLDIIKEKYSFAATIPELISFYRFHQPQIELREGVKSFLEQLQDLNIPLGIITDGRSITQRNKLNALAINHFFQNENIIISEEFGSEKPAKNNYLFFQNRYNQHNFVYFGDNIKKDFVTPNQLGWQTVGLTDNGNHIHKQNYLVEEIYKPKLLIKHFENITLKLL